MHTQTVPLAGVKAQEFRAKYEDHLDELDELGDSPYVERRNDCYRVKLLTLAELKDENEQAESLLTHCRQLFDTLRDAYRKCQSGGLTLGQLVERTGLQEQQVRVAAIYLAEGAIPCSRIGDLLGPGDFTLTPGESYLKYKTFDHLIKQLYDWERNSSFEKRARITPNANLPLFCKEMRQQIHGEAYTLPDWYNRLPEDVRKLMTEVHYAIRKELSALPSMGLRSAIDWVCNDLVGDIGGFSQKLQGLVGKGLVSQNSMKIIENTLEVGHASTHRGYFPQAKELQLVVHIVERLLEDAYILTTESERLRESVPKRAGRNQKSEPGTSMQA